MKGAGEGGVRVVGLSGMREKTTSNFLRHFRDVTTGTPGTGVCKKWGGGLYMTTKQARTVCGFHPPHVIRRTQKPVLFCFYNAGNSKQGKKGDGLPKNPATGSGEEPERFEL